MTVAYSVVSSASKFTTRAKAYLIDLGERAGKSFAQGAAVVLLAKWSILIDAAGVGNWSVVKTVLGAAAGGGLVALGSVITSVLSAIKTGTASASRVVAETAVTPHAIELHAPEHAA